MIHEFIDYKKKTKNSGSSKGKTLQDSVETCSVDQSGSEWPPTTLVPPWLNHLGLKLKNNHINGVFDHKTEKLNPDFKNQNEFEQDEDEEGKSTVEENEKSSYFESSQKDGEKKESTQNLETSQKKPMEAKSSEDSKIPVIWSSKAANIESSSTDSLISFLTSKKNFKTSETEISAKLPADISLFKSEQSKREKIPKKRHKIKRQIASGCASMLSELNIDSLLEERAKEILENYSKKNVHSAVSDIKRFEAKLLLLQTKINLGKLTPADLRWLHNIRVQAGSKENFDNLMQHVREANLKEIFDTQNCILKSMQTDKDVINAKTQPREEGRILVSTDDEDNVKRFSELLRKNQSEEEKRKCLEEVRNYFERKRRTRLTKCCGLNANLNEKKVERNEDPEKKKTQMKKAFSLRSAADWKSKFKINDAEVVAKAVDETLQKFVELYKFHVSPSVINSMKNKVLRGIQGHSFECESPQREQYDISHDAEGDVPANKLRKNNNKKDHPKNESLSEDLKANNLKERAVSSLQPDETTYENDKINWLKSELEDYINNINKEATKLIVQSIILEEERKDTSGKNVEFTYSLTKKSLEQKESGSVTKVKSKLSLKDVEVQVGKTSSTKNTIVQTLDLVTLCDKFTQREKNPQKSINVQTEGAYAVELKKLKESDVSAGLYRMVKSKEASRFYLYPEKSDQFPLKSSKEHSKNDNWEDGKLEWKKLSEKFGTSEHSKIKSETKDMSGDVMDDVKPKHETDVARVHKEKEEYLWLWDGEKINSVADLKAHVECLVNEKLKQMSCGFPEIAKHRTNHNISTQSFAKAHRTGSHDDLEFKILHLGFPLRNDQRSRHKDEAGNFKEGRAETQSLREPIFFTSEEKLAKNSSMLSSEKAFSPLIVKSSKSSSKSQQSWKRTYLRKKGRVRERRKDQSRRNIADLKCLFNKRMRFEDSLLKNSVCGSGSTVESNISSCSKNASNDLLTLVFGLKDDLSRKNNKFRRMVNQEVQINNGKRSATESEGSDQRLQNHTHWKLVEKVLHRVNRKERRGLWDDLRELIKSKMGKDIDNENAKEICIQIEQDLRGTLEEKAKHAVLAKGHYTKDEGDVEVEIDLTLNDLERIIRRRERSWRRQGLCYKRNRRNLKLNSQRQSKASFSGVQEFRHILRSVSKLRPSPLSGDVRIIKRNKEN